MNMQKTIAGTVVSVYKVWWMRFSTKTVHMGASDGAVFPHIVRVRYMLDGREHLKRRWILSKNHVPAKGDTVQLLYDDRKPEKIRIVFGTD